MARIADDDLDRISRDLTKVIVEPSLWPHMLDRIARAAGATGAALLSSNPRLETPSSASVDATFEAYRAGGWFEHDLRRRGMPRQRRGEVILDEDILLEGELDRSPFYNEFLPSVGLRWWAGVGFPVERDLWCLSIQRSPQEGAFHQGDKASLARFSHRLSEVASLSLALGAKQVSDALGLLDRMGRAALIVDDTGRGLGMTTSASRLLGPDLRMRGGGLAIADPATANAYGAAVASLRDLAGRRAPTLEPIVLQRRQGPPLIIKVLPLDGEARQPFMGGCGVVFFEEVRPASMVTPALAQRALKLTPAEARLAVRIASGVSLTEAAHALGIAKETARNQIKSVYAKTGARSQSQLTSLLGSLSSHDA